MQKFNGLSATESFDERDLRAPVERFFATYLYAAPDQSLEPFVLPVTMWTGGRAITLRTVEEFEKFRKEHFLAVEEVGYSKGAIEEFVVLDAGPSSAIVRINSTRENSSGEVQGRVETFAMLRQHEGTWHIFVLAEKAVSAVSPF